MSFDFQIVYDLVDDVPKGSVASYGMLASLLPGVTARMVGRALAHLNDGSKTPWHRIVNSAGKPYASEGRVRLEKEDVAFRPNGNVDWKQCRWSGPSPIWIQKRDSDPMDVMEITSGWRH